MRKLKLQMQVSIDGFVAGPEGQLDWMTWQWDDKLKNFANQLTNSCDTILLGRKMTDGFIGYWESITPDRTEEYPFAQKMVDYSKIVFSKTLNTINGKNARVENGDLVKTVKALKKQTGKDIVVYGGASFVSALIDNNLIDELYLFINPTAIGSGLSIFKDKKQLQLVKATAYKSGIVVLKYKPKKG